MQECGVVCEKKIKRKRERERYGRRMLQDIRAEAEYKKQDNSRSLPESERDDWEKESTS